MCIFKPLPFKILIIFITQFDTFNSFMNLGLDGARILNCYICRGRPRLRWCDDQIRGAHMAGSQSQRMRGMEEEWGSLAVLLSGGI